MKGKEDDNKGEERISPEKTYPPQGVEYIEQEVATTLPTLGTPVKPKRKKSRPSQMYLGTRNTTKIRQGKPQTPKRVPIIIDESPSKKEEIGPSEVKIDEVTPKTKTKSSITLVSRPTTKSLTFKKSMAQYDFVEDEKEKLHED